MSSKNKVVLDMDMRTLCRRVCRQMNYRRSQKFPVYLPEHHFPVRSFLPNYRGKVAR